MKTYRNLLDKLLTLSNEQLDSNIFIINGQDISSSVEIIIDKNPVYIFTDFNNVNYNDFADEDEASEYNSTKIVDANYPCIKLI